MSQEAHDKFRGDPKFLFSIFQSSLDPIKHCLKADSTCCVCLKKRHVSASKTKKQDNAKIKAKQQQQQRHIFKHKNLFFSFFYKKILLINNTNHKKLERYKKHKSEKCFLSFSLAQPVDRRKSQRGPRRLPPRV